MRPFYLDLRTESRQQRAQSRESLAVQIADRP